MGCAGARTKQPAAGNAGRCVTRVPPRPPARCAGATTLCASTFRPSSAANAPACAVGERAELRRQTVAPAPPMLRAVTLWCSIYFIAACGTAARTAHSIRSSWRHFQMHGSPASALVRQKLRGQSRSSVGRGCNVPCGQVCGAFLCRLLPGECGVMLVCVRVCFRAARRQLGRRQRPITLCVACQVLSVTWVRRVCARGCTPPNSRTGHRTPDC